MPQDSLTVHYSDSTEAYNAGENSYYETQQVYKDEKLPEDHYVPGREFVFIFLGIVAFVIYRVIIEGKKARFEETISSKPGAYGSSHPGKPLRYVGKNLGFSLAEYKEVLTKHSIFYQQLNHFSREEFISRLKEFIKTKIFLIHDKKGFKEMPILVSASSIQLSFGLDNYLLPHFKYIHIYPQEFLRVHPALCFLQGNVSGHSIRLSWKHFLLGIQHRTDGQHVGLHEMAHALYYQAFVCENNTDNNFQAFFDDFSEDGNKVYEDEQVKTMGLYSSYAIKNFQEFWAESIELFFEKPQTMKQMYPSMYDALKTLLNQDPASFREPVM